MKRLTWYNPMLDSHVQAEEMTEAMRDAVKEQTYSAGGPLHRPDASRPANLVSSLCDDGLHRPALDLDGPHLWVPSSTEGHGHLYVDAPGLTWPAYRRFIEACGEAGVLADAYVQASIQRGQTLLRPPGVSK